MLLIALFAVSVSACAGKSSANNANFLASLQAYYAKGWIGEACIQFPQTYPNLTFPYAVEATVNDSGDAPRYLDALAKAHVLKVHRSIHVIPAEWFTPEQRHQVATYSLINNGGRTIIWSNSQPESARQYYLCYGSVKPTAIDDFSVPEDYRGRHLSQVHYHVQVANEAAWARSAVISRELPEIQSMIDQTNATQRTGVMVLTNDGWTLDPNGP